jgi:hypothetical protein
MVERWNIGFQKDISHFNFIVNPVGGGTINPTLHYPLRARFQPVGLQAGFLLVELTARREGRIYEPEAGLSGLGFGDIFFKCEDTGKLWKMK